MPINPRLGLTKEEFFRKFVESSSFDPQIGEYAPPKECVLHISSGEKSEPISSKDLTPEQKQEIYMRMMNPNPQPAEEG